MEVNVRKFLLNKSEINIISLEEIAEVRAGISTGDNNFYLLKKKEALGPYKIVNLKDVVSENEIKQIHSNKKLRDSIIERGISKEMFNGRTILPYDKGGSSDIESGRLSNYFAPTKFYINWSEENLQRMKTLTIADRKRFYGKKNIPKSDEKKLAFIYPNKEYFFRDAITFSGVGLYSPTYRLSSGTLFEQKAGSSIFIKNSWEKTLNYEFLMGILCSKLIKYIQRNFINNTVNFFVSDVKKTPISICDKNERNKIIKLVTEIIKKQKVNEEYSYQNSEQIEIDNIVYQIYGLNKELIKEIENWFMRKFPKLIK